MKMQTNKLATAAILKRSKGLTNKPLKEFMLCARGIFYAFISFISLLNPQKAISTTFSFP